VTEDQIASALISINTQLATLSTNNAVICRDVGEIKALLERQNGRVRTLETTAAREQERTNILYQDVVELKKDGTARNGLLWSGFNSIAVGIATWLALQH